GNEIAYKGKLLPLRVQRADEHDRLAHKILLNIPPFFRLSGKMSRFSNRGFPESGFPALHSPMPDFFKVSFSIAIIRENRTLSMNGTTSESTGASLDARRTRNELRNIAIIAHV